MRSFNVLTPHYEESVIFSLKAFDTARMLGLEQEKSALVRLSLDTLVSCVAAMTLACPAGSAPTVHQCSENLHGAWSPAEALERTSRSPVRIILGCPSCCNQSSRHRAGITQECT
jgi:hypothetical protein